MLTSKKELFELFETMIKKPFGTKNSSKGSTVNGTKNSSKGLKTVQKVPQ